jgi:hypothetical protein
MGRISLKPGSGAGAGRRCSVSVSPIFTSAVVFTFAIT